MSFYCEKSHKIYYKKKPEKNTSVQGKPYKIQENGDKAGFFLYDGT